MKYELVSQEIWKYLENFKIGCSLVLIHSSRGRAMVITFNIIVLTKPNK